MQILASGSMYWYVKCFRKRVTDTMSACVARMSVLLESVVKRVCNVKSEGLPVAPNSLYIQMKVQARKNVPVLQIYDNSEKRDVQLYT